MPLSSTPTASRVPIAIPSLPNRKGLKCRTIQMKNNVNFCGGRIAAYKRSRNLEFVTNSVAGDSGASVGFDVRFPSDYSELLEQAKEATELALKDGKQLMEIEFPTAGLGSVPGDGEGGIEMTGSMQLIREFCDLFINPEKVTRTRIFFPEANEVEFARKSVFGGASFKLDYLTKPSLFEDFGFVSKVKMADRVKPEDEMFLVGYPYFNVNEMLVVEELYREAVVNTARKLIIFNGELDRIRSGCILCLFYAGATLVPGRCLETLEINMFACISKKLCHPSRKLPWIFFRPFDFQYVNHLVQMANTMFSNSFCSLPKQKSECNYAEPCGYVVCGGWSGEIIILQGQPIICF